MKLPDFTSHSGFNELRKKMGAELIEVLQEDPEWTRLSIQLGQEGVDVGIDEVELQPDSTFEYKGQKVIVYIRDQQASVLERGREYKFHIAQCDTLDEMHRKKRSSRYVVTNRKDGKFVVNVVGKSAVLTRSEERSMKVCKNCISTLGLGTTPDKFSIEEFFRKYASKIKRVPVHNERTAPLNVYPDDWRNVSNQLKMENDWQCEECGGSFKDQREFLHTHHIDGDKSNNSPRNLRVLCAVCHGNLPGHEHMKGTPDYKRALKRN